MGLCASTARKDETSHERLKRLAEMEEELKKHKAEAELEPMYKIDSGSRPHPKFANALRPGGVPVKKPTTTDFGF